MKPTRVVSLVSLFLLALSAPALADAIRLASASSAGGTIGSNGDVFPGAISSADGRFVALNSSATNHLAGGTDLNGTFDSYIWDRDTQTLTLVSHAAGSPTTTSNGTSFPRALSSDGRWLAFYSTATDLVAGVTDGNGLNDVFLWDRETGTTKLVSHLPATPLTTANGASAALTISSDGRYIVYQSDATNLITGGTDTNGGDDVFVWDRINDTTVLVSGASGSSTVTANASSSARGLSADGRRVVFFSAATNMVAAQTDANGASDMFLRDLDTATTVLISHTAASPTTTGNGQSTTFTQFSCVSADGRYVTYTSAATNLVASGVDSNGVGDVLLWDAILNTNQLVSHIPASLTTAAGGDSQSWAVSADGSAVVFNSVATNLITSGTDTNGNYDVFLYNRLSGAVQLISHTAASLTTAGNGQSEVRRVSTNGRIVSFRSWATNLITGTDTNTVDDSYHWDALTGAAVLVSHTTSSSTTAANGASNAQTMSSDGMSVALISTATNLAAGTYTGNTQTFLWSYDSTAPTGAALGSPVPPAGAWTNDDTVALTWSGATDEANGSGLSGYSFLFDQAASTDPGKTVDILESDPHGTTSSALTSAPDWYFHLRTCDHAGNCSAAVHAGPFQIDTEAPGAATALSSPDHTVGVASNDPDIDLEWTDAVDPSLLSGLDGYATEIDGNASWSCDQVKDIEEGVEGATANAPGDGSFWFHLCARDNAGNWGPVASLGPFEIDATAATVAAVGSVAGTADGVLTEDEETLGGITRLLVEFDDDMADPAGSAGAEDVTNPANYRLFRAGHDGQLSSVSCAAPAGDDVAQTIADVGYSAASTTASLSPSGALALPRDLYRLIACPTLEDDAGSALALFTRDFRITANDLLPNPNFDADLSGWTVEEPGPGSLLWSESDAGDAEVSGSAEIVTASSADETWTLSRCLGSPVGPEEGRIRAWIASATPGAPSVTLEVEYWSAPACAGASLGSFASSPLAGDTAGIWAESTYATGGTPAGARSARVSAVVAGGAAAAFTVRIDDLFHGVPSALLIDGFESGTTAEWSAHLP